MQELFFMARHTPFWAIPLLVLGAEFGYMFWLKKKKWSAIICVLIALVGTSSTAFYIWAGGPEKSVKQIRKIQRSIE